MRVLRWLATLFRLRRPPEHPMARQLRQTADRQDRQAAELDRLKRQAENRRLDYLGRERNLMQGHEPPP